MDMPAITEALRSRIGTGIGLGATLMFDCAEEGVVVIDGRSDPHTVANERIEADCTVTISRADLVALMTGQLDPMMGFMTGQFRVAGDMAVALKLQRLV
ncbi:MAG: SCP2 sterol-binding domain-containing protein [Rubrivivax sp.]